jgi:hypothetical protein
MNGKTTSFRKSPADSTFRSVSEAAGHLSTNQVLKDSGSAGLPISPQVVGLPGRFDSAVL